MDILNLENISKEYEDCKALENINLKIKKGEFVAIIGQSGSGKSTLLNIIAGIDTPTKGKVYIKDTEITSMKNNEKTIFRRKNIGYIYQFYNLLPTLNVRENIILPVVLDERKVNKKRLDNLIKELGLATKLEYLPNELSGGQQQRVAIARALISNPVIVLADEPTGNLDRKTSRKIIEKLKYYNQKFGQTIIMVTHDEKLAKETDRIITVLDGKIIKDELNNQK